MFFGAMQKQCQGDGMACSRGLTSKSVVITGIGMQPQTSKLFSWMPKILSNLAKITSFSGPRLFKQALFCQYPQKFLKHFRGGLTRVIPSHCHSSQNCSKIVTQKHPVVSRIFFLEMPSNFSSRILFLPQCGSRTFPCYLVSCFCLFPFLPRNKSSTRLANS